MPIYVRSLARTPTNKTCTHTARAHTEATVVGARQQEQPVLLFRRCVFVFSPNEKDLTPAVALKSIAGRKGNCACLSVIPPPPPFLPFSFAHSLNPPLVCFLFSQTRQQNRFSAVPRSASDKRTREREGQGLAEEGVREKARQKAPASRNWRQIVLPQQDVPSCGRH